MVPLEEIFILLDDFCKYFEHIQSSRLLANPVRQRRRLCSMHLSEIMTIVILFHFSHYRTFKDFYTEYCLPHLKDAFPTLVSYNRFVELIPHVAFPLLVLTSRLKGQETGKYYVDSTKLQVCDNLRIHSHKVFKGIAKRGKTSTGWFFGMKLHLVINNQGEIMSFRISPGNTDDRAVVEKMTQGLQGWLFGDKGYLSQGLTKNLAKQGLSLITRVRKNMKEHLIDPIKKCWLDKRGVIESVIDQMKSLLHVQHTRHRSPYNFVANLLAGIMAYILKPKKPSVSFSKSISSCILMSS